MIYGNDVGMELCKSELGMEQEKQKEKEKCRCKTVENGDPWKPVEGKWHAKWQKNDEN